MPSSARSKRQRVAHARPRRRRARRRARGASSTVIVARSTIGNARKLSSSTRVPGIARGLQRGGEAAQVGVGEDAGGLAGDGHVDRAVEAVPQLDGLRLGDLAGRADQVGDVGQRDGAAEGPHRRRGVLARGLDRLGVRAAGRGERVGDVAQAGRAVERGGQRLRRARGRRRPRRCDRSR